MASSLEFWKSSKFPTSRTRTGASVSTHSPSSDPVAQGATVGLVTVFSVLGVRAVH